MELLNEPIHTLLFITSFVLLFFLGEVIVQDRAESLEVVIRDGEATGRADLMYVHDYNCASARDRLHFMGRDEFFETFRPIFQDPTYSLS